ncbi:MAG: lipid-binding SYLF domain-containing protein [Kiloniellales bacterium]
MAWASAALVAIALILGISRQSAAASDAEELVDTARYSAETLISDPDFPDLKRYISNAKGVLIIPQLIKGGFFVGGEGGSGVLLVRGSDGSWSPPAFYTLAAGSFGLQFGGQVSEVVFTIMNVGAVNAMLTDNFKLGGDISIAVGPFGKGLEASTTTNFQDDVYAFSKSAGLFGGGALEGAGIFPREKLNIAYYGEGAANPRAIVIDRKFFNPHADRLRNALP